MPLQTFIPIAADLETAGLVWQPEIGDEILVRDEPHLVSILVDPAGMTPGRLRATYMWLPNLEQLILQVEARQGILYHAGFEASETAVRYKTIIQSPLGALERSAESLRDSLGLALRDLLTAKPGGGPGKSFH